MYGNSGNIWGIIIGIIIVAIVIFLIAREFMCWYFKINKLVTLMEEQNNLLKQQLGLNTVTGEGDSRAIGVDDAQVNSNALKPGEFIVTKNTSIFAGPGETYRFICEVKRGEILMEKKNDGIWSCVIMKNGNEGWCKKA